MYIIVHDSSFMILAWSGMRLPVSPPYGTMHFMLVALISVLGSGLVGILGMLVHFILKQGAAQRDHMDRLHGEFMAAIAGQRDHMDRLHREAMVAIAGQRDHTDRLHAEAMAAIAALGERMVDLHLQAMAAVAALGERTAALETKAGWR